MATFYVLFAADAHRRVTAQASADPDRVGADARYSGSFRTLVFAEKYASLQAAEARVMAFTRMSYARRATFIDRRNPDWQNVRLVGGKILIPGKPLSEVLQAARAHAFRTLREPLEPGDDGFGGVVAKQNPVVPVRPRSAAEPLPKPDDEESQ